MKTISSPLTTESSAGPEVTAAAREVVDAAGVKVRWVAGEAGLDANPTAMILSAVMMLRYIGEAEAARRIEAALSGVLGERRCVTPDLGGAGGTRSMTAAIVERLVGCGADQVRGGAST